MVWTVEACLRVFLSPSKNSIHIVTQPEIKSRQRQVVYYNLGCYGDGIMINMLATCTRMIDMQSNSVGIDNLLKVVSNVLSSGSCALPILLAYMNVSFMRQVNHMSVHGTHSVHSTVVLC